MFYTKYLLLNKQEIYERGDIESDEFNDLLILLTKEEELFRQRKITAEEHALINRAAEIKVFSKVKDKEYLANNFELICIKLSTILGGVYTNSGYISYMQKKYNLNCEQLDKLENFMKNTRKYNV